MVCESIDICIKMLKEKEGDINMGKLGKVLLGTALGVGAIAAAPFTGGGSILAGASLASSLAGAGTIALATGAGAVGAIGGAVVGEIDEEKRTEEIKNAKSSSFKDGVQESKAKSAKEIKKYADFMLATTALSFYAARCDGRISKEEQLEIDYDLDSIRKNTDLPDQVKNKLLEIEKDVNLSWKEVIKYLNKVSVDTLERLYNDVDEIVKADGKVTKKEKEVMKNFSDYLAKRKK